MRLCTHVVKTTLFLSVTVNASSDSFSIPEVKHFILNRNKKVSNSRASFNPSKLLGADIDISDICHLTKVDCNFGEDDEDLEFPDISEFNGKSLHNDVSNGDSNAKKLMKKTGTTIVGCVTDGGRTVVIAADTRATAGSVVADKRCEKVHRLAANVWCCGAGTSGDIDAVVRQVQYSFLLRGNLDDTIGNIEFSSKELPKWEFPRGEMYFPPAKVSAICRFIRNHLYKCKGGIGVNLVVAGYDFSSGKAILAAIHPHGSIDYIPYTALGSGGLAAMSVLESGYSQNMSLEQAIDLVKGAVKAGITNDLGSGSQIDLCIINKDGTRYRRAVVSEEELSLSQGDSEKNEELHRRYSAEGGVISGVNGFSSLPYAIKRRQIICKNEKEINEGKIQFLENLLSKK